MLRNRKMRSAFAVCALLSFFTACYTQRPLTGTMPGVSTRIIAFVTDTGSVVMSNAIGPGALQIEGIVVAADPESWTLQLVRVDQRGGFSTRWNREVVTFPRFALTNTVERVLNKNRSWLLAGLMTALVLSSMLFFGDLLGGENPDPPTPPPV